VSGTTIARKTNNLALVGFIIAFVIPIAGLVLGIVARKQLDQPNNNETGRGFARWATIVGMLGVLVQIWFIIIWVSVFTNAMANAPGLG
jgi:Domain of unknown function (DUF4190)